MASSIASTSRNVLGKALRKNSACSASAAARAFGSSSSKDVAAQVEAYSPGIEIPDAQISIGAAALPSNVSNEPAVAQTDRDVGGSKAERDQRRMRRVMLDHMSTLGSTQNRNTSFRPHHTRLSPTSARELTLSHLLAATAQVGHSTSSLKPANQPYIYGTRHKLAIIDVETATIPALRRAAAVVRSVCERDGVVLFVGTRPGQQASVLAATKRLGGNGFHVTAERWMPGVITNAPKLLAPAILKSLQGTHVLEAPNTTKLASQTLQPDLVILLNPIENAYALREATQANIPTIAITDTDVDPRSVTYPIPANDDSLRTAELIIGVLSKAGQEGLRERQLKLDEADKQRRRIARQKRLASGTSFDPRMRGQQASPAPAPAPSSD